MSKIEQKISKEADEFAKLKHEIGINDYHDPVYKGFCYGAKWALSHQWRSVEKDGLPKSRGYEYYLFSYKPVTYEVNRFLLLIEYNDGSGHDYCEADFKVLPDGRIVWLYDDNYIAKQVGNFKVTHWMPIPPLPEGTWEGETRDGSQGQVMVEIPTYYSPFISFEDLIGTSITADNMMPIPPLPEARKEGERNENAC